MAKSSSKDQHRARSIARLAAVQALYQIDILKAEPQQIIDDMKLYRLSAPEGDEAPEVDEDLDDVPYTEAHMGFFEKIVKATVSHALEIDDALSKHMKDDWSVDRVDANLRAIMRCAVAELIGFDNVPPRVVLMEYTDIADAFFGTKEKQFLAGILNAVARDLKPDAFQQ